MFYTGVATRIAIYLMPLWAYNWLFASPISYLPLISKIVYSGTIVVSYTILPAAKYLIFRPITYLSIYHIVPAYKTIYTLTSLMYGGNQIYCAIALTTCILKYIDMVHINKAVNLINIKKHYIQN